MIEMAPAAAFAEPEKRTVLQPDRIDARILPTLDPRLARFPEDVSRCARFDGGAVEVKPRLSAVLNLVHDIPAVRCPTHIDDQEIRVLRSVDPAQRARSGRNDGEPYYRVWIARLRILPALDVRVVGHVVDECVIGNGLFVELEKRHAR